MSRPWAVLLAAAVLAGCSSPQPVDPPASSATSAATSEEPAATPTPAAEAPAAPEAGACYRLGYDQVVAPTSPGRRFACTEGHTTQTFFVGRLDRVVGGRLLAVDSRRLQAQVATACPARLPEQIGGTEEQQRLSMLRAVWFTPTVEQSDAGADWFRCDVVALARSSELLEVTGSLAGVLDTEEGRARYGLCGTAEPGTDGFARVACSQPHRWRALSTVALAGPDFPGEDAVRTAGEEPCRTAAQAAAESSLDFEWGYEWPTADQWAAGQTYGLCWVPS